MDLSTNYLGMKLKNPVVPSASPLSKSLDNAKRLEDAGAGALVMYSLFEEEVRRDDDMLDEYFFNQDFGHVEASSYRPLPDDHPSAIDRYIEQIHSLKESLEIPIIASLNGVTPGGWTEHAQELQVAGADALELNIYHVSADTSETGEQVEQRYVEVLMAVKQKLTIPIIVKLSPHFSSVAHMVRRLEKAGADGVALFNRFYQPGIDLDTLEVTRELNLSTSADSLLAMRWIAILYNQVKLTLAATGGIHTADDAMRLLLAGADVTHLCAALLQNGPGYIAGILAGMERWMELYEYESVEQLKGSVCRDHASDPSAYERANYIEMLKSY
jgi:dihydroorotate dehydrogenase (fumarate)